MQIDRHQFALSEGFNVEITDFSSERLAMHRKMATAYQKFLKFVFLDNVQDKEIQESMNEARIKFLSIYFAVHMPVSTIFNSKKNLAVRKSGDRRYLIADYYSHEALVSLRAFPRAGLELAFEHVIPKDLMRRQCENAALTGELPSVEEIAKMLDETWHIAVVTRTQDRMLKPAKSMPKGWTLGGDVLARYRGESEITHFPLFRAVEDADACIEIYRGTAPKTLAEQ